MKKENRETKPWSRLKQESDIAFHAFTIYRDQGGHRSLAKTAKELGKEPHYKSQLEKWSKRYEWVRRTISFDEHLDFQKIELASQRLVDLHNHALDSGKKVIDELVGIITGNWCEPQTLKAIEVYLETIGLKRKNYTEDVSSQIDWQKRDEELARILNP